MMKNLFLVFICLSNAFVVNSQIKEVKVGCKIGANFLLTQGVEDNRSFQGKTLYHAGVTSEFIIGIKKKFSLQTELLFSAQGFSETYYDDQIYQLNQFEEEILLNYLSLPIMAKYKFNEHFGVEVGPYLSYLISEKRNLDVLKGSAIFHPDNKYFIWNKDFGIILGINYQLNKLLNINFRYNYGLLDIVEFNDYNTQMFQFSIAYIPKQKHIK